MITAIDFGSVLNKVLVFNEGECTTHKFSLTYSQQKFNRRSLWEAIKRVEKLLGKPLLGVLNKPLDKIYVATSLPLTTQFEPGELATKIVSTHDVVTAQTTPVLDVGFSFISFLGITDLGVFEPSEMLKWLPFKSSLTEVENYLDNRRIYSHVLPVFPRDLYLEQAAAREKIIHFLGKHPFGEFPSEIILSGGIFSASPYSSQSLLLLLDSLGGQPKIDVYLDKKGLNIPLGLFKMFESEVFEKAAPLFVPEFLGTAMHFERETGLQISLGLEKPLTAKLEKGKIFVFPLSPGETAKVTAAVSGAKEISFDLTGGSLGLIFDGREFDTESKRPVLPTDVKARQSLIKEWEKSVGATGRLGAF